MKIKKKIKRKSQFMREYYYGHYEEPVWFMMKNSEDCKAAEKEYVANAYGFFGSVEQIVWNSR